MEIKGTAVKSTLFYVKEVFPERYDGWVETLSVKMKEALKYGILAGNWYDLHDYILEPTKKLGDMFFDGNFEEAAFEVGKFSAKYALKGVYKIFVKVASVEFVLKRTTSIFSTYYSSGKFEIIDNSSNIIVFLSTGFKKGDELIFKRIEGWVKGIFEVISKNDTELTSKIEELANDKLETKITLLIK